MRKTETKVQGFHTNNVHFVRMPYSPYQYRYYMRINNIAIRVSKDVYYAAKRAKEGLLDAKDN